ncbi:MAG: twin-arginine translocation signal domain-containing protein [Myxococcales bacterium]|nr:twin-arginine translocation signal domain-containing protein [Myxococcales bacterium]
MNRRRFLGALAALAAVGACAKADTPADPVWGKEPCAHCRMLVSDKRYAAQAAIDGERKYFDDVGCLVLWAKEHRAERTWVRDSASGAWVSAESARFQGGARTPMDYGFEARSDGSVGFAEVREKVLAKGGAR